ncbi:MAG: hypothetical protein H7840_15950 [Alphaproteobacteria bacterium]
MVQMAPGGTPPESQKPAPGTATPWPEPATPPEPGFSMTGQGRPPDELTTEARKLRGEMRLRTGSFLRQQKTFAAQQVGVVADALRLTARGLREGDGGGTALADLAGEAALGLDRLAGALYARDIDTLTDTVRDFARRRPGLVVGGAALAGFLAARLLGESQSPRGGL